MRRILCVVFLVLLAVACGTVEPEPAERPTPTPTPTPTPMATPTPTPDLAPLTGLPVDEPEVLERPVLVVKVDNLRPARPQTGLEHADIVMVELVEGATRFIAFYHSEDPGVVGPVRSGRLAEADLLPPLNPVFAMSGAHGPVGQEIRSAVDAVYEEGQGAGWFRDGSRRAPHNLYVTATDLWAAAPDHEPTEQFWDFDDEVPEDGSEVTSLTAAYPQAGSSGWEWDADAARWLRLQDGGEHQSIAGERLAADTVAVLRMEPTGRARLPFNPIGEGEAVIFRDGQQFEARWRKESRGDHLELLTADDEPFPLQPGQTWVELLPTNGSLDVQTPGD